MKKYGAMHQHISLHNQAELWQSKCFKITQIWAQIIFWTVSLLTQPLQVHAQKLAGKPRVFIADPCVVKIPIRDNQEPCVDMRRQTIIRCRPLRDSPSNPYGTFIRRSVYEKLLQAQKLLPPGIFLRLYEGYRPLHLQKILFHNRYASIQRQHPSWSAAKVFVATTRFVSPTVHFNNTVNVPAHNTGGAFDIHLVDKHGAMLPMGINMKETSQDKTGALCETNATEIPEACRVNRRLMSDVLTQVGFANYWTEYWHWSYGDRYHAYIHGLPYAVYGAVNKNTLHPLNPSTVQSSHSRTSSLAAKLKL